MLVKLKDGRTANYRAVWFEKGMIKLIDQRLLPYKFRVVTVRNYLELAQHIRNMTVRGAPAIGVAASYGIAQAAIQKKNIERAASALKVTRPTAYDLFYAIDYMLNMLRNGESPVTAAENYAENIIKQCYSIGVHGAKLIRRGMRILTHCNAGALATVDYGTALAPIRLAKNKDIFVFVDETRPRLQGAKLTAWELLNEGIPHAVIPDNAAGFYMYRKEIDMVIVGADRITANGDFANKIGTYEKAVLAKENGIPFYVAAPSSSFDPNLKSGAEIIIEERGAKEVEFIGRSRIVPVGTSVRNPAFDITPAKYVTGFITEHGVK